MRYSPKTDTKKKYIIATVLVLVSSIVFGLLLDLVVTKIEYIRHPKPEEYSEFVEKYSEKYDVPEHIIYAVIKTESGFDYTARSGVGAIGLMQIMPDTFEELTDKHLEEYYDTGMLYDAETNIRYGTYYLSYLYDIYGDWSVTFAAYNGGLGNVNKWLEDKKYSDDGRTLKKIPVRETKNYVEKVEKYRQMYDKLYPEFEN